MRIARRTSSPLAGILRSLRASPALLAGLALAVWLTPGASLARVDEFLPVDSPLVPLVRELDLRGYRIVDFEHERPYPVREIAARLSALLGDAQSGRRPMGAHDRALVEVLLRELRDEVEGVGSTGSSVAVGLWADGRWFRDDGGEERDRLQGIGQVTVCLGPRVTLLHRSWVDTGADQDPSLGTKNWEDRFDGVTEPAYIVWQSDRYRFLFGRDRLEWGPGFHGGLLASGAAPALDRVQAEVRFSTFQATAFAGELDSWDLALEEGGEPTRVARYISGHRLAWRPADRLEVSASEVIVYGGEGRTPEVRYLMPAFFYYAEQWNLGDDDNPLWAFDLGWRPAKGTRLYGEFLVDDFQYDTDTEPQEIAYLAGAEVADPPGLRAGVVGLEYARVQRWTYGQAVPWNRYLHDGVPIGHPLGADADGVWVRMERQAGPSLRLRAEAARVRRGEGRIEDDRGSVVSFPGGFPSGVVETRTSCEVGCEVFAAANRWLEARVGWVRLENAGHVRGSDRDELTAGVRVRLGFEAVHRLTGGPGLDTARGSDL